MAEKRRTALVSGSGRNIGRAIVLALAGNGFDVVVNGSSDEAAIEAVAGEARALGVEAISVRGDVGIREDADRLAAQALERFGAVDVLVNNAAIRPAAAFLEMTDDEWDRVMAIDLHAAFWLSRAFLPDMVERRWGRIVNFAGMNAIHGHAGRAHVSAAKHGAWGLTKTLAKEFGAQGITANIVSPGPIRLDHADPAAMALQQSTVARVPAGRLGEPGEVAAVVSMLVSDAGAYVNGQMIQVNGGGET
ncbi:MAG: SDR family oxidoreductase [Rhodospirillales bacterium]|jgi:3-oxoacyl-[acyl-carrier protein] reductase|nr:SDR family oxidoreductase [Rhodospirillales bacterium]MDP6773413.1 SDR family oxidoreductase [Rhodospirillales bacterium]